MSAVGAVVFTRRYWKCTCGRDGAYAADELLGVEGLRSTQTVPKHWCRLAAETSLASASEPMQEMLGVDLCPETVRTLVEGRGQAMARSQAPDTASAQAFQKAAGEVEFTTDAGKVNTREEGWKDLKIAVFSKRQAGEPTTPGQGKKQRLPAATMVLAFAMIATAKEFRKGWRPRLRRLGVTCLANVQALADGAGWIGKAVQRVRTGCVQTLDFFHACAPLSKCAQRIHGEETKEARIAYRQGRSLLARHGWAGVCQWVGELLAVPEEAERERRRGATDRLLGYCAKHGNRLNYAAHLKAGRAIGSGQVEGKAKTLGVRLKLRGARWKKRNVAPMASLVCVRHASQWDAYWAMAA
ncbi:MAG TPA: hypothetical protein VKU02_09170 [Gemmataceae bacterium]|nr:hypothetical protein [Gemmataceae bacterium]